MDNPISLDREIRTFFGKGVLFDFFKATQGFTPELDVILKSRNWERRFFKNLISEMEWADARRSVDRLMRQMDVSHFSVSHSKGYVFVVASSSSDQFKGIGIDFEPSLRVLSERMVDRITTEAERQLSLRPIEVWSVKEACFKADSSHQKKHPLEYTLKSFDLRTRQGFAVSSKGQSFQFSVFEYLDWTFALASC